MILCVHITSTMPMTCTFFNGRTNLSNLINIYTQSIRL